MTWFVETPVDVLIRITVVFAKASSVLSNLSHIDLFDYSVLVLHTFLKHDIMLECVANVPLSPLTTKIASHVNGRHKPCFKMRYEQCALKTRTTSP